MMKTINKIFESQNDIQSCSTNLSRPCSLFLWNHSSDDARSICWFFAWWIRKNKKEDQDYLHHWVSFLFYNLGLRHKHQKCAANLSMRASQLLVLTSLMVIIPNIFINKGWLKKAWRLGPIITPQFFWTLKAHKSEQETLSTESPLRSKKARNLNLVNISFIFVATDYDFLGN